MREPSYKYIPGDPWGVCDLCGFKYRRSELRENHEGFIVCKKDYEPQHPQEFVRGRIDRIAVADARPEQTGGDITLGTATAGDGWTDNGNGTYTSDGTSAGSSVTFSATLSATAYYQIMIRVTDGGATGTVKGVCGGLETDEITTGYATKYGQVTDVDGTIGITQASNWTGTVWVMIRQRIQQGDL